MKSMFRIPLFSRLFCLSALLMMAAPDDAGGTAAAAPAADADDTADPDAGRPDDISPEEWKELAPAERAAIAAGDGDDVDEDALAAIAARGDPAASAGDDAAAAEAAAAAAAADKADADAHPEPATFTPSLRVDLPADFDEQVTALKTKRDELRTQFRAGDLELDEYEAQREAVDEQLGELNALKIKADIAAEQSRQTAEQRWAWECENFYAEDSSSIYRNNKLMMAAHNATVMDLASEESLKAHPERAKWSGPRYLREADKLVRASMGVGAAAPKAGDGKGGEGDGEKPPRNVKKEDPKAIPPAIRTLPAAAAANVGGDEFAHLADLNGIDYERAIARMTPDQQERFRATA